MAAITANLSILQAAKSAAGNLLAAFAQCDSLVNRINAQGPGVFAGSLSTDDIQALSSTSTLTSTQVLQFIGLVQAIEAVRQCTTASQLTTALAALTTALSGYWNQTGSSVDQIIAAVLNG